MSCIIIITITSKIKLLPTVKKIIAWQEMQKNNFRKGSHYQNNQCLARQNKKAW